MLFHITHTHSGDTCPYHEPEVVAQTFAKVMADAPDSGVTLVGAYADAAAHQMFFVVEADAAQEIQKFLDPIIDMGDTRTQPVVDFAALTKERAES